MNRASFVSCLVLALAARLFAQNGQDSAPGVHDAMTFNELPDGIVESQDPVVDLHWMPESDWGYVGDVFRVELIAQTDSQINQSVAAIDVALQWDSDSLTLLGVTDDGDYSWLVSGYPNDSALDNLNGSFLDGDAFYQALARFGDPATATPTGLHVTTFLFEAVGPIDEARIEITSLIGSFTESKVQGADILGQDVTGQLGTIGLLVCTGSSGDDDSDGIENCFDMCLNTPADEQANSDGCSCGQVSCDDGAFCNGTEACQDGECQPGNNPCDDGITCTSDACDDATSTCSNTANNDACQNAFFCDGRETCDANFGCVDGPDPDCDDQITCTADSCDESADRCVNVPDHAACDDGLFCNGIETCSPLLNCQPGVGPCTDPSLPFCNEGTSECVECLEIGDHNGDGMVALQDFAMFLQCETGPAEPTSPPLYPAKCRCFDASKDGDIDSADFAEFQRNVSR